jgi:hypothetical protein
MKRLLLSAAIILGFACPSFAAITVDNFACGTLGSGNPTSTIDITVNSGSNRVVVLFLATGNQTSGVVSNVSGAGGTWSAFNSGHGAVFEGSVWVNKNPTVAATQTTTITWTAATNNTVGMCYYSLNGVDQTTPLSSFQIRSTAGNLVVTSAVGDLTLSAQFDDNNNRTVTGCTSSTDASAFGQTGYSIAQCAGAATTTFTWSAYHTTSVGLAVNVKADGGGAATPRRGPLLGVLP